MELLTRTTFECTQQKVINQTLYFITQINNSRQKFTAFCGMCGNGILLGPYFFEGKLMGETTEKGIF